MGPFLACRTVWVRRVLLILLLGIVAAACTGPAGDERGASGVTAVINAAVYTVDPEQPEAEAFAYDATGVIIAVGSEAVVLDAAGKAATIIDAEANFIVPGFQDPHVHVPEAGINAGLCFMSGNDLERLETQAQQCSERQPDSQWVRAAGPSLFNLRNTSENPIDVLDRAIPNRPALILDDLGHAVWTNTLGLEAAGIEESDPDPQGGVLHRDATTGRLTGLLLEDAQQLVRNAAAGSDDSNYQGLLEALDQLAEHGVTSVSDAGGYWAQNHPAAWQRALDEDTLTVRAANSMYVYPALDVEEQLAELKQRFANASDLLRFDTAKIYVDGILDLGTASLVEPYDSPVDPLLPSGFSYFRPDQLRRYVSELHTIGYRINFHVIGDAAVRTALDSIEAIDDTPSAIAGRRHRTTHNYLVHPDDIDRFARLGVIADFQQSGDAVATDYHEFLSQFIGDRALAVIPTAQLLEAGARVTLSSDWDAGPLPPLGTIERALTRDANAVPDLETALGLSTIEAAYALGHDDTTGSITIGKFADFVILDQNLFDIDVHRIDNTRILATFLNGKAVYEALDFRQLSPTP